MSDDGEAWTHEAPMRALRKSAPMLQQQMSEGILEQLLLRTYWRVRDEEAMGRTWRDGESGLEHLGTLAASALVSGTHALHSRKYYTRR
jgi:hypothetical protein